MEILESDAQIINQFMAELSKLGLSLSKSVGKILERVKELISSAIKKSPEYDSLLRGELRQHFGLRDPQTVLNNIVEALLGDIEVNYAANGDFGGISIKILNGDYSSVLSADGATYESNGYEINWLEWLLKKGQEQIISDYSIVFSNKRYIKSRAGYAIMQKGNGSWGVPEFSGTEEDNWLTRALHGIDTYIEAIVQEEINAVI